MKNRFYKESDKLWSWAGRITDDGEFMPHLARGEFLLSFDKKKVYNLFRDWEKFTHEQKEIIKEWNPVLYDLLKYRGE